MKTTMCAVLIAGLLATVAHAAGKENDSAAIAKGEIVVNAGDGAVLYENNADAEASPASVIKLMDLLIILEKAERGEIKLADKITVTAEVAKIGGSQVYLKENETFSVDELLYALMVQSANDAAVALAIHAGGTKEAFVQIMNQRAAELGMTGTKFHSVHGLPPDVKKNQEPDVSTPRDFAHLCVELLKHKQTLGYSSVVERTFRQTPLTVMRTHNHLLENYRGRQSHNFKGCDGLKTGYFRAAGYSIAATASNEHGRVVAVVFGCPTLNGRDARTRELLTLGLRKLSPSAPSTLVSAPASASTSSAGKSESTEAHSPRTPPS